jgi:pimeloyl-ACP methyl ester carboxylesterase
MEANSIVINGKPVFYRKTGTGQAVVLVHGFSEDGTVWENQVEPLKSKYQLIIPDLPGSGQSTGNQQLAIDNKGDDAEGNEDWSMEYFAESLIMRILPGPP